MTGNTPFLPKPGYSHLALKISPHLQNSDPNGLRHASKWRHRCSWNNARKFKYNIENITFFSNSHCPFSAETRIQTRATPRCSIYQYTAKNMSFNGSKMMHIHVPPPKIYEIIFSNRWLLGQNRTQPRKAPTSLRERKARSWRCQSVTAPPRALGRRLATGGPYVAGDFTRYECNVT